MALNRKLDRKLFTAKFKRDYVAFSAVAIFCLIVVAEIGLAISIPMYFVRSNLWDMQVARQQLLNSFDILRRSVSRASFKVQDAADENAILLWDLNHMADYLRFNAKTIEKEEIALLKQDMDRIWRFANRLKKDQPFNHSIRLKPDTAVAALTRQLNEGVKK